MLNEKDDTHCNMFQLFQVLPGEGVQVLHPEQDQLEEHLITTLSCFHNSDVETGKLN